MQRDKTWWADLPEDMKIYDVMERLHTAVVESCSCGGTGPNEGGCLACRMWHYVIGRTAIDTLRIRQFPEGAKR